MHAIAAPTDCVASVPLSININTPTITTATYTINITITLLAICAATGRPFNRTGFTACGCTRSRKIFRTLRTKMMTLIAFNPPVVDPAMPPQSDNKTPRNVIGTHHPDVSVANDPVVVTKLMVCTTPQRIASPHAYPITIRNERTTKTIDTPVTAR